MNHETQRLLFAAARGARVQRLEWYGKKLARCRWKDALWIDVQENKYQAAFRIRPDDIELQYGPISTELRRRAAFDDQRIMVPPEVFMADVWWHYCRGTKDVLPGSETGSWLCLFAAELAADEGL